MAKKRNPECISLILLPWFHRAVDSVSPTPVIDVLCRARLELPRKQSHTPSDGFIRRRCLNRSFVPPPMPQESLSVILEWHRSADSKRQPCFRRHSHRWSRKRLGQGQTRHVSRSTAEVLAGADSAAMPVFPVLPSVSDAAHTHERKVQTPPSNVVVRRETRVSRAVQRMQGLAVDPARQFFHHSVKVAGPT